MFLYRLVNLLDDNLYLMITVNCIISLLCDTCVKYDLNECLYNFITRSSTLSKGEWKHMVSLKVMSAEKEHWYVNINLYSSLKLCRGLCVKLRSLFGGIWLT